MPAKRESLEKVFIAALAESGSKFGVATCSPTEVSAQRLG